MDNKIHQRCRYLDPEAMSGAEYDDWVEDQLRADNEIDETLKSRQCQPAQSLETTTIAAFQQICDWHQKARRNI